MTGKTSRAAGAQQLIALLHRLAVKPATPGQLMADLGLPRTTLFRLRRDATEWGVQILATASGWEVANWGVFERKALRAFHVKQSSDNRG